MNLFITELSLITRALDTAALFNYDVARANNSEYFADQAEKMIELKTRLEDMMDDFTPFYKIEAV